MWYGSVLNSDTALIQDMKDNTAYTVQDRWVKMPIAEYINGYRDQRRVRGYCLECGRYGKCWACPPFNFDEGQYLRQFTTISLLATKITPSEGVTLTQETMDRIISLERQRLDKMLLGMEGNARAFFAGTCLLCPPEQCTRRKGLPCRHQESIRPSLEALGFDIARTAADIFNTPLQWSRNGQPPKYLTLISALARKF